MANQMSRSDGLDNPMSPNGAHPQFWTEEPDGTQHGPYSCLREAQLAAVDDLAEVTYRSGGQVTRRPACE
jgi:hypothetical protein